MRNFFMIGSSLACLLGLTACGQPGNPPASAPIPATAEPANQWDGLEAVLRNAQVDAAGHIVVDFVLINHRKEPIQLAERWNSWGAYQWSFVVTDAKGRLWRFGNSQTDWTMNCLTTFAVTPGGEQVTHCLLSLTNPPERTGDKALFVSGPGDILGGASPSGPLAFPCTLAGVFAAEIQIDDFHKKGAAVTNWAGQVQTPAVRLEGR